MAEAAATPISAPIVVLVDGSVHSRAAVRFAAEWARETGAPVLLRGAMAVWHRSGILRRRVQRALSEEMDRYAAELSSIPGGVAVSDARAFVRFGGRTGALAVAGEPPLAVVMGMEGHGGWESTKRAAAANEVAASVDCPVIVVPDRGQELTIAHRPVVVGLSDPDHAEDAFAFAMFWARAHAVPVIVLRGPAVSAIPGTLPADLDIDDREISGDLGEALLAESSNAGLIVVGRAPSDSSERAFRFLDMLRPEACACPVAVVRPR